MPASNDAIKEKLLERTRQMLEARVKDVMTTNVITVDYNDLSARAGRMILENGFLGLLVIKEGRPFNMITAFDLLRLSYEESLDADKAFLKTSIGEIVEEKEFLHVKPESLLRDVLNLMIDKKVRTVAVLAGETLKGIISVYDMMQWYRGTHDEIKTGKI